MKLEEDDQRDGAAFVRGALSPCELAFYGAGGTADARRRVVSMRFLGGDLTHVPGRWVMSSPFPGLGQEQPAGAPLDHPLFPVPWERN